MERNLRFEATYQHSPARVWQALTDQAALEKWLMRNDFQARMGHKFQFRAQPRPGWDGVVNCEVVELDPPRKLAYRWVGGPLDSIVRFSLEPVPGGTRLVLEHNGFKGFKGVLLSFMMGSGWGSMVRKHIPKLLELWDGTGPVPLIPGKKCE